MNSIMDIANKNNLKVIESSDHNISKRLHGILKSIRNHNPEFLTQNGYEIETKLNFDKNWGLGSSSTLISNLSKLADVDPYLILNETFGGSGYDIACSNLDHPILYSLNNGKRFIQKVEFTHPFYDLKMINAQKYLSKLQVVSVHIVPTYFKKTFYFLATHKLAGGYY